MPHSGPWATVLDYLTERFPAHRDSLHTQVAAGDVVDAHGQAVDHTTPFAGHGRVYVYRPLPVEVPVPFELTVLHRDEHLLVVDKPHFLATMPRGAHVVETALTRLRRRFDLPELSPAHRLDRLTAGVLVFTVHRDARRPYQTLFAEQAVEKEYEALAPFRDDLALPTTVRSRIVKTRGVLQAREVAGTPNAETHVDVLARFGDHARYRLRPRTGRTHQLRVHMNSLGLPLVGDPLYPEIREVAPDDFCDPLRLLARRVRFTDPLTGLSREFVSNSALEPVQAPEPVHPNSFTRAG
nr:pseudouridine synthase [Rhodococcus sp. HNM0569]